MHDFLTSWYFFGIVCWVGVLGLLSIPLVILYIVQRSAERAEGR